MNKVQLVEEVATNLGFAKKDVNVIVENVFKTIAETLELGEEVAIYGFGKFETKKREGRVGRNPKDGSEITIPEKKVPTFKAAKALKDVVDK